MTIRIDTDLPGGTRARAWVDLDVIVVEHSGRYTVAMNRQTDQATLAHIADVLTEASQP